MAENLSAAASALGLPEALVERSAAARAAEIGASVDDVLNEWAGGEAASSSRAEAETEGATVSSPRSEATLEEVDRPEAETEGATVSPAPTPDSPEVVIEVPSQPAAPELQPTPAGPFKPPVLVGASDSPRSIILGALGLFLIVVLVGLVGPSIPEDIAGARSSALPLTTAAEHGRDIYATVGCASCHTQMVRPIIADVGLGAVTLNDSNQVLGARRFGPDLSDVGTRMTADQIEAIVAGLGEHPPHSLSGDDMNDLVAYLAESRTATMTETGEPEPEEDS
jgi:mono/diheme cytochrome c family protein